MYAGCGPQAWLDVDYLHWWLKNAPLPVPLLTTSPPSTSPSTGSFGILDRPGTEVVLGNTSLDQGQANGVRVTAGAWLDCFRWPGCRPVGLEVSYFNVGQIAAHVEEHATPIGQPLLARPVMNALTNSETSFVVSAPTLFGGDRNAFKVDTSTQLWGAEANFYAPICGTCNLMVGGLLGFRYLNLEESLDLTQITQPIGQGIEFFEGAPLRQPNALIVRDHFGTRNHFYGAQLGAQATFRYMRLSLDVTTKLALGTVDEVVSIDGSTTARGLLIGSTTVPGGLLALGSNTGKFGRDQFALLPEGMVRLSYQLTDNFAVNVGYSALYISEVARPGHQIDRSVNPNLLPASQTFGQPVTDPALLRPNFDFHGTDFSAHGISAGFTLSF
jgi:hypothetical protein